MTKYIHYCWFGEKKMPSKLKKYIQTWEKYLPDHKIMLWNEKNFDIESTNFSKKAYELKKWAFVADVARIYALKKYGGIYFDTDIEVINDISYVLDNEMWFGRESEEYLATAMFGVKDKNNKHINNIFNIYKKLKFNEENIFENTNPKIITKYFEEYGFKKGNSKQVLKGDVHIYPREYFNPKSYDGSTQDFTNNTAIVHHFDATWTPLDERIAIWFVRKKMSKMTKPVFFVSNKIRKIKEKKK